MATPGSVHAQCLAKRDNGKAPFEVIMGHIPRVHQTKRLTTSPPLNQRLETIDAT